MQFTQWYKLWLTDTSALGSGTIAEMSTQFDLQDDTAKTAHY